MTEIKEGIIFDRFDSKRHGLYLFERDAPTPSEKEITEDIPFMQGVHDFSMILGERVFENRDITYVFKKYNIHYENRKTLENKIKDELMSVGQNKIIDTHDPVYYWFGKAKSVKVDDDHEKNKLVVTIVFDCYPFLLKNNAYFDDVWDTFNFDYDVANWSRYKINGKRTITLINTGSTAVSPTVIASSPMTIIIDGDTYSIPAGTSSNVFIKISRGINKIAVSGNGEISVLFRMELMA
ncbi:hypothetical protein P7H62_14200 [Vagococcus carniphilus]|uniref:hypothetical protein n=1 Tax=Vagococcus carniphilus TaxID=218144 RepID=UPI002892146D|nr:hypothetical protein [Vagococcus carniphilus]MDT2830017.1 hypothetical protein [Vagococcus carniphilus]MDT2838452.1 hypothetical protein [Vagococcus carniphilus]MDT2855613.1 hypothetical protein [Vagococcus carniphilus]